jgi:hypothetical protein
LKIFFYNIRNSLKAALSFSLENAQNLVETLARDPENANSQTNLNELFNKVDAVSDADVNSVNEKNQKI